MSESDRIENVTPAVRLRRIQELLALRGSLSLREAVTEIAVSEMTLRRDFATLERQGVVDRTWGGVIARQALVAEIGHDEREQTEASAKFAIAALAASCIEEGETVFLSGGTTALAVARQLSRRSRLTIITTSIPALLTLLNNPDLVVIAVGGRTSPYNNDTTGPQAQSTIASFRADKAIIGATGISGDGVFNANLERAAIDRLMVEHANSALVVADHSKIGRNALTLVTPFSPTTTLVTDLPLPRRTREQFDLASAQVILPSTFASTPQTKAKQPGSSRRHTNLESSSNPLQIPFKKEKSS